MGMKHPIDELWDKLNDDKGTDLNSAIIDHLCLLHTSISAVHRDRIYTCVNALAGVEKPGETMELVRRALKEEVNGCSINDDRSRMLDNECGRCKGFCDTKKALAALGETGGASDES